MDPEKRTAGLAGSRLALVVALTMSAGACDGGGGDNGGPAGCLRVQPCGGDLVGTWRLQGGCLNVAALSSAAAGSCPEAVIAGGRLDVTGTVTFGADLTYSFDIEETFVLSQRAPLACSTFASCAELEADLAASNSSAACTGTTTCSCTVTTSIPRTTMTGTYAVAGSGLTLMNGATPINDGYCVQGDTIHVMSLSTTMTGPTGQPVVLADDVGQRE